MNSLIRKPSAWIPIAIPLIFLGYIIIFISIVGIVREEDEGIGAHLFQLWLVLEPFLLGYFVVRWWPTAPKPARFILALQIIAALLPIAVVFSFQL